jgi:hypothetical protein
MALIIIALMALVATMLMSGCGDSDEEETASGYTLVYFDGHMHTVHSDGSGQVSDIKETALSRGLGLVIVTDHCKELTQESWEALVAETAAASDSSFLALPAFEVTGSESFLNRDHILAWNVPSPFVEGEGVEVCPEEAWPSEENLEGTGTLHPENLTRWVDLIHSQGGIALHAHPAGSTALDYGVDYIEVYNQSQIDDIISYIKPLGFSEEEALPYAMTIGNFAVYGERDIDIPVPLPGASEPLSLRAALKAAGLQLGSPEVPLASWDDLLMAYVRGEVEKPTFAAANSDAHNTVEADSKVGTGRNGLYVTGLTPEAVYEAIRAGRSFATTGPSLDVAVDGKMMGETAAVESGKPVKIAIKVESGGDSAILTKIDVIKNGELLTTLSPNASAYEDVLEDFVSEPGYYRVEVTARDETNVRDSWAWSNPVFVTLP